MENTDKVIRLAKELVNELKGMGFNLGSEVTDLESVFIWIDRDKIEVSKAGKFYIKGDYK